MLRPQQPSPPNEVDRIISDPFAHLGREHAELSRVYRLLDRILGEADDGLEVDRAEAGAVIEYAVYFGDLRHHDKEESILIPVLVENGFDWFEGPVARMRRDHRQERYHFRVLEDLVEQDSDWYGEDRRRLVRAGRAFLAFVTAHMDFENEHVFRQAQERLSAPIKARLLGEFEKFDRAHDLSKIVQPARAKVAALMEKYAI